MKTMKKVLVFGAATISRGPYYGPYYGGYGPYNGGEFIVGGYHYHHYYGWHHFYGHGFGARHFGGGFHR